MRHEKRGENDAGSIGKNSKKTIRKSHYLQHPVNLSTLSSCGEACWGGGDSRE
jgi:hypothetical protein